MVPELSATFEQLDACGYACFESVSLPTALQLGTSLGPLVPSVRGGPLIDELRPTVQQNARPHSLSIIYGKGAFPFHTDSAGHPVPPRYLLLRLSEESHTERPTLLLGLDALTLSQEELLLLYRDVWIVNAGRGRFLTSILSSTNVRGYTILRYDMRMMHPAHSQFGDSSGLLEAKIRCAKAVEIRWRPGMLLVVDNWRMMHARGESWSSNESRVIQRLLVVDGRVR